MEIEKCRSLGEKEIVTPPKIDDCTFVQIDSWNADEHAKSCDTLFIMSDGSGAYFWNGSKWEFLTFGSSGDFVTNGTFESFKTTQDTRDDEQDAKINSLENQIPQITQTRTTFGVGGSEDSPIFNPDVISNADLLWTKEELPEGNLVSINGNYRIKEDQPDSYKNVFWTSPEGFELSSGVLHFIPVMGTTIMTSASINAMAQVGDITAWSNFGKITASFYMLNVKLRGK